MARMEKRQLQWHAAAAGAPNLGHQRETCAGSPP